MFPFCCCYNYAKVGHIVIRIFSFVVLSVITDPHCVSTSHISKPICTIVSLNVSELELIWCPKDKSGIKGSPTAWGWKPNSAPLPPKKKSLKNLLNRAPSFHRGMRFNLNRITPVMHELKWAQMNPNELKRTWISKWVRMSLNELK